MKILVASLVLAQYPLAWSAKMDRPFHSLSHRRLRDSAAATHHSMRIQDHPITRIESAGQEAAIQNFADILDHIKPINAEPAIKDESADDSILAAHPELQARVERVPGAKKLSKVQQEMIAENLHLATKYMRDDAAPVALAAQVHGKAENKVLLGGTLASHMDMMADVKMQERGMHFNQIQEEMIAENLHKDDLGGRLPLPPLPPAAQMKSATVPPQPPMPNAQMMSATVPPQARLQILRPGATKWLDVKIPATLAPSNPQSQPPMPNAPSVGLQVLTPRQLKEALKEVHSKQQGGVSGATVMQAMEMKGIFAKHPELTDEVERVAPPGANARNLEAIAENLFASEHARGSAESLAASSHDSSAKMMSTLELQGTVSSATVMQAMEMKGFFAKHPELTDEVKRVAPPGANARNLEAIAENLFASEHPRGSAEMDSVSLAASSHDSSAKMMSTLELHPELMADVMNAAPPGAGKGALEEIAANILAEKVQRTAEGKEQLKGDSAWTGLIQMQRTTGEQPDPEEEQLKGGDAWKSLEQMSLM